MDSISGESLTGDELCDVSCTGEYSEKSLSMSLVSSRSESSGESESSIPDLVSKLLAAWPRASLDLVLIKSDLSCEKHKMRSDRF